MIYYEVIFISNCPNQDFHAIFLYFPFLDYISVKTNKKKIQTTTIDVKFDEKFTSELEKY